MYDLKELYEAESVSHAISLLQEHPEARIIAGGSDILIKIRAGELAGCELISIYGLLELEGVILEADETLRILPLTSFSQLTEHPLIKALVPVLGEAADTAGGPQLRNIGTVGGNICNGATSADTASTLMAYDAVVELTGPQGIRKLPLKDFYVGPGKVALQPAELLTAILIRKDSYDRCHGYYIKYAMRNAMDIATLGCSANVVLSEDKKTVERLRLGYGVAGPTPLRSPSAEAALAGKPVSLETIGVAAAATIQDVNPRTSWRASKELRVHLVQELAQRAMVKAIERAGGEC